MKKMFFYAGLIVSSIGFMMSYSCTSRIEPTNDTHEIEEDIDALSSEYASLYADLAGTIFKECKKISESESDANVDEHFKNFEEEFLSQLSSREIALINRFKLSATRSDNMLTTIIPDDFISEIKPIMFNEDVNLLVDKIAKFYMSSDFLTLNDFERQELQLQLETLIKLRNSWIDILTAYAQPQPTTRMSPGDRMIWSDIARQMTPKQQSNVIDASFYGIGLVCGALPAGIVGAIALAKSIFWPY